MNMIFVMSFSWKTADYFSRIGNTGREPFPDGLFVAVHAANLLRPRVHAADLNDSFGGVVNSGEFFIKLLQDDPVNNHGVFR